MKNVRISVGSNSASMWWMNGEEVLLLSGDRRMVMDDALSPSDTQKGETSFVELLSTVGMSDFCVRILDENGEPVRNINISCE